MGRLVVNTFTSLDGVMQAPGMPDEDRAGGFEHGGWQVPYFDEESGQVMIEHLARFDALLLGRKTYEICSLLAERPGRGPDRGQAEQRAQVRRHTNSRQRRVA